MESIVILAVRILDMVMGQEEAEELGGWDKTIMGLITEMVEMVDRGWTYGVESLEEEAAAAPTMVLLVLMEMEVVEEAGPLKLIRMVLLVPTATAAGEGLLGVPGKQEMEEVDVQLSYSLSLAILLNE